MRRETTVVSRRSIYKFLIDIIFPNRCPSCGRLIRWDGLVCGECEKKLPFADMPKINIQSAEGTYTVFMYEGAVKDMIYALKHGEGADNFAEFCAVKLCKILRKEGIAEKIDIVTAVPMDRRKKRKRGCNQAEVIARFVSKELDKPRDFTLLERRAGNTEQHTLSPGERRIHAREIYTSGKGRSGIKGKTALICDDVITTGATMSACCGLLLKQGAKAVYCCSAATSTYNA